MQQPHDRQLGEVFVEHAAGRRHPRPAVTDTLAIGPASPQLANEVRAVQVATRLADGEEDFHCWIPAIVIAVRSSTRKQERWAKR